MLQDHPDIATLFSSQTHASVKELPICLGLRLSNGECVQQRVCEPFHFQTRASDKLYHIHRAAQPHTELRDERLRRMSVIGEKRSTLPLIYYLYLKFE